MDTRKLLVLALAACGTAPPAAVSTSTQALTDAPVDSTQPMACPDPTTFGATFDGSHDDTDAWRLAVANCGDVAQTYCAASWACAQMTVPVGTSMVSQHLNSARCVDVPSGVSILGSDRLQTVVKLMPNQAASVRPFFVGNPHVSIGNLSVDGNRGSQATDDEHRAGIIVSSTYDVAVSHVTSHDNTGDAIYVGGPTTHDVLIDDMDGRDNDRDGVAITGGSFITTTNSYLHNNRAQNYDTEPGMPLHDIVLSNTVIDAGTADTSTYVGTFSGAGIDPSKHSYNFDVYGNTFYGPVFFVYLDNSSFHDNLVVQTLVANYSAASIQGGTVGLTLQNNTFTLPAGAVAKSVINVQGNPTVGQPSGLKIIGNTVNANSAPNLVGILLNSIRDGQFNGNTINGNPASTFNYGISLRSAAQGYPVQSFVADGNTIYDFPTGIITFSGVTPMVPIMYVEIDGDTFTNDTGRTSTVAMALNYNMGGGVYDNADQVVYADNDTVTGYAFRIKPLPACPVN